MIVSNSLSPKLTLYYIGSKLISILKNERFGVTDSYILFEKLLEETNERISFTHYMYALNWLYLLDLVKLDDNGDIRRCF